MSEERRNAIRQLKQQLTGKQKELLRLVIETADVQGDYRWNGEDSVYEDDVNATLRLLARELCSEDKT